MTTTSATSPSSQPAHEAPGDISLPTGWSSEAHDLARIVGGALQSRGSVDDVRRTMEGDSSGEGMWNLLARELDLLGVATSVELGGSGGGIEELGVVMEQVGRSLTRAPFLATTALAIPVLTGADSPAARMRLRHLLSDGRPATLVSPGVGSGGAGAVRAFPVDGGWHLKGTCPAVLAGGEADLLLVHAVHEARGGIFAVEADAEGLTRVERAGLDHTRSWASVSFDGCTAEPMVTPGNADALLSDVWAQARALLAAEQVGAAQRAFDMSMQHVRQRHQFGQPLGRFQSVKHKLADLFLAIESSRSLVYFTLSQIAAGHADAPSLANVTQARTAETLLAAATANVQLHGGIGVTWEHDAHLIVKRAVSDAQLLGSAASLREEAAAYLAAESESRRRA